MDTYIVRQPILNREEKVEAYELVYFQDSSTLYNQRDARVANAIIAFFNNLNGSEFLDGKDAFLTFTPNLLMQNVPRVFDEKKLVIQVEDNILVNPEAKAILERYQAQGYRLALLGFEFNNRYLDILPIVDMIKIDFTDPKNPDIPTVVNLAKKFGKKTAAYNVNTPEARAAARVQDFDYIQGQSVAEMISSKARKMEHLQSNFFRLMVAVSREMPDFDEIAHLISLDVTLTYSLLKMVNSAYFALPNQVKNIKQALTMLGLGQLKQWIYLLSFTPDDGLSDELIKLSFLRATFCQEFGQCVPDFPASRSETYLLGMFSTLDTLLEVPLKDAVKELPISDAVKDGLLREPGACCELLELCISYEKGLWSETDKHAAALHVPTDEIAQKYLEAVEYVNDIWRDLMKPFSES